MSEPDSQARFIRLRSRKDGTWMASPDLRPNIVADAEAAGTTLTEIVIRILSKKYKVEFEPSSVRRQTNAGRDQYELNFRLPRALDQVVCMSAVQNRREPVEEMKAALHAHYGLRVPASVRSRTVAQPA